MLLMGQEESIRDLVTAYRLLPPVHLHRVRDHRGADSSQPVTFRYGSHAGRTYLYAVNDAPFRATARVRVDAPAGIRIRELTGTRQVSPLGRDARGTYWMVELQPYDLVAVEMPAPNIEVSDPQVSLARTVETALGQRIRDLADRVAVLPLIEQSGLQPALRVLDNPGFELEAGNGQPVPGWLIAGRDGADVALDPAQRHGGMQSVKISSTGPAASLVSLPFKAPTTGRLLISAWLRVAGTKARSPLQLKLEGNHRGEHFERWFPIGTVPGAGPAEKSIDTDWSRYVFPVDDLPLEGPTQLRLRFDLVGPGEVWIDDVQMSDLAFHTKEVTELKMLFHLALVKLQNGKVGDCMRLLEGYWPQFLEENVPLQPRVARQPDRPRLPAAAPPKTSPSIMDRMKDLWPKRLRP